MELEAKGRNPYLAFSRLSGSQAVVETELVLGSFEEALITLNASLNTDAASGIEQAHLATFMQLNHMYEEMLDKMDEFSLLLNACKRKVHERYLGDLLEDSGEQG